MSLRLLSRWVATFGLSLLAAIALARHPANVPVARARVQPSGEVEVKMRFDILAFILDVPPTEIADAPMNALLDGPDFRLEDGLSDAKAHFLRDLRLVGGTFESIEFPKAADIHAMVEHGPKTRLPVMATITLKGRLAPGTKTVAFRFPQELGTVVLTTEFPYMEPVSESVDPEMQSTVLTIPTQEQVDKAAALIEQDDKRRNGPSAPVSEDEARKQIQLQYNAWSAAYMKNDVDTLMSILTPDYSIKTATGDTITHSEYAVMLKMRKERNQDTAVYSTEILRITLHGNVAALFSREKNITKQKDPKTGKTQTVDHRHDYLDVWVFAGGKWMLQSTATQKESTQIK